jgi:hypothetical protein
MTDFVVLLSVTKPISHHSLLPNSYLLIILFHLNHFIRRCVGLTYSTESDVK